MSALSKFLCTLPNFYQKSNAQAPVARQGAARSISQQQRQAQRVSLKRKRF
jgi:hypothetical protein